MVKLVALYGRPADPAAFDAYYSITHRALVDRLPSLKRFEPAHFVRDADGSEAPYHVMAELYFDSAEELQASMGSAEAQAAVGDIPNFADGGATALVASVD